MKPYDGIIFDRDKFEDVYSDYDETDYTDQSYLDYPVPTEAKSEASLDCDSLEGYSCMDLSNCSSTGETMDILFSMYLIQ